MSSRRRARRSADKEDDDGVADCDGGAVAAAAQGYVDVVAGTMLSAIYASGAGNSAMEREK